MAPATGWWHRTAGSSTSVMPHSPVLRSPTQSAMAWPSGRVRHSRAPCGTPSPGAHVGAVRGCGRGSARPRRARGPDPTQDGHRIGGLGGQRRLRGGRRRLRERVVHVHRVEVRPRGVECTRCRRARQPPSAVATSRMPPRASCAPSTTIRPAGARRTAAKAPDRGSTTIGRTGTDRRDRGCTPTTVPQSSRSPARLTTLKAGCSS